MTPPTWATTTRPTRSTFELDFGATYSPPAAEIKLNDQLSAVGISGLVSANGSTGISVDASYAVSLGFGLDLSPVPSDTPLTDRLFIETAGTEISGDATVCADLDLMGTLGFVEMSLADQNTDPDDVCSDPGYVPILTRRATDGSNPMVTIDLDGGPDGKITLTDLYENLGSLDVTATGNEFALTGGFGSLTGTINAAVPSTTVDASATIGSTNLAGAELTFGWSDILNAAPEVSGDPSFNDDFLSFNFDPDNPLALFNQIIDTVDTAMAAIDNLGEGSILDEELPIIGTSPRESLNFLNDVRDKLNEIAQNPAGSLQRLEIELELAIAEAVGMDLSGLSAVPDPNDPIFIDDQGTPDPGDDVFDDAAFQAALDAFIADVEAFLAGADFIDLSYIPGNSPGAILLSFNIGVCSSKTGRPDCTHEIPLETAFNFDLDALGGSLQGLIAAEGEGELALEYGATVRLDVGLELPDLGMGELLPRPFVADTSNIALDIAGVFDGAFNASIGPFEVQVGNVDGDVEDCTNDDRRRRRRRGERRLCAGRQLLGVGGRVRERDRRRHDRRRRQRHRFGGQRRMS